jgi:hypothetical protein
MGSKLASLFHTSMSECHFYIDDSGPRDPDRKPDPHARGPDFFALGGLIIDQANEAAAKEMVNQFRARWPEMRDEPLRSYDIRWKQKRFRWLADVGAARRDAFFEGLTALITSLPLHVLACVVDRNGYNRRYTIPYGRKRWSLCKTAFNIAVERAAKVAAHRNSRLRVYVEQTDKKTEAHLLGYFNDMRNIGLPFDPSTSAQYRPLPQEQLHRTLLEFRVKSKSSTLMQIADLVLWPVCQGGYDTTHRAYMHLKEAGKLVEFECTTDNGLLGTKYSCFDSQ